MVQTSTRVAVLASALVLLAGCSTNTQTTTDGGGGTFTHVGSIALVPAAATMQVGDSLSISTTITATDGGTLTGVAVVWSSSDSTVASIDQTGKVTAAAVGEVDIAAAAEGVSASAHIKVVAGVPAMVTLSVSITGSGTVTGPTGFSCASGTCTASFAKGTTVALEATAASGSIFSTWGGGCSATDAGIGTSTCSVVLSSAQSVSAAFEVTQLFSLVVTGEGTVTSTPAGISCQAGAGVCSARFPLGTALTLSESPASGSFFTGFGSGAAICSNAPVCDLTLNADVNATANFAVGSLLTVNVTGDGEVTSSPMGISCSPTSAACSFIFPTGTPVTLSEMAEGGTSFLSWSGGGCSNGNSCAFTLSSDTTVGAAFTQLAAAKHTVTISISGSGSVTSSNSSISCTGAGGTCSAIFNTGDPLSLIAAPAASFFFGGWSGAGCGIATACSITVNSDLNLTAAFNAGTTLTVAVVGSGSVVSSPSSIACPGTCASSFALGGSVHLYPTPSNGFAFTGWSGGGCSGTLVPCTIALNAAATVTATFTAEPILTVTVTGSGTVMSSPPGISCVEGGGSCSAPFPAGQPIILSEQAGSSLQFGGWGGACAGTAMTCSVTISSNTSATAQFGNFYTLSFTTTGNGTVSADSGALQACGSSSGVCSAMYLVGTQVVLTESPTAGAALSAWSGACASASGNHCTLTMSAATSAGASFSDATTLSSMSGDQQTAPIDGALPLPIVIHLVDNTGGANVPGATVSLAGPLGSSVVPSSVSTDSQGLATFSVRLSRMVGTQTFTATTQTASPLLLTASATAPAVGSIFTLVNTSHNLGFDGFPGPATTAHLRNPTGLVLAADGTLYIADSANNVVFALSPAGSLTLVAGTGTCGSAGNGGPALSAQLCTPYDLALDETNGHRTLYIADSQNSLIRAVDLTLAAPEITTFAGGGGPPGPGFGDGLAASQASLSVPTHISLGPDGYLYIGDTGRSRVRRVSLATQVIENWAPGDSALCGFNTCSVSWDASGRAFITRQLYAYSFDIVRVNANGSLTTVAGGLNNTETADGTYATLARLFEPGPTLFDGAGNMLVLEQGDFGQGGYDVRRIALATSQLTTIAGNGTAAYLGDYTPATGAELNLPWASALDANGNLYISDAANGAVREVWGAGQSTVVHSSISKTAGDQQMVAVDQITPTMQVTLLDPNGQPLTGFPVQWQSLDPGGVMFAGIVDTDDSGIAAADGRVGLNSGATWHYTASATDLHGDPLSGSPITFQDTSIDLPADYFFTVINTSHMDGYSGIPGSATAAQIPPPVALIYSADGTLYFAAADGNNDDIFALSPVGVLTHIAGSGACGYTGDTGPASSAQICNPIDLALDETHQRRTLYVTDLTNNVVRAIDLLAVPPTINTIAGGGTATTAPYGDGALATLATLAMPNHVTVDPTGTYLYVSEYGTGRTRIRRITLATGIINVWLTIDDAFCAQSACKVAFSAPDDTHPNGMAFYTRGFGSYYFGIYRVDDPETPGTSTLIAGDTGYSITPDGPAIGNYFFPGGLIIGPDSRLYLADPYSHRVRVLSDLTTSATMITVAGIGSATGTNGLDGPAATSVGLNTPWSVAFSPNGSLLIADSGNFTVREIWKFPGN